MAIKSAISGEYIITVEDNGSIRVCQIFDDVAESLHAAADAVKFKYNRNWDTKQLGTELVDTFGDGDSAIVDEYTIVLRESGDIETYRVHGNSKKALRKISEEIGFTPQENWNTRQFGNKLIDFIEGTYVPDNNEEVEVDEGLVAEPGMTAWELQEAFRKMFGGHLRIKNRAKRCDAYKGFPAVDITLGELGLKERTAFSCDLTVGQFENTAAEAGLRLKVATKDDFVTVLEDFALDFVGQIPACATKDKMQAILDH